MMGILAATWMGLSVGAAKDIHLSAFEMVVGGVAAFGLFGLPVGILIGCVLGITTSILLVDTSIGRGVRYLCGGSIAGCSIGCLCLYLYAVSVEHESFDLAIPLIIATTLAGYAGGLFLLLLRDMNK